MLGSGWLRWRASASCRHRSLRCSKLWTNRLWVGNPQDSGWLPPPFGLQDLLMGHMTLLRGIVVLLGLLLPFQLLVQDLQ